MRLRRRVQLLMGALAMITVLNLGLDLVLVQRRDESQATASRFERSLVTLSDLLTALVDEGAAEGAFLVTGDEAALRGYEEGRVRANKAIGSLQAQLAFDPSLAAAVERIQSRVAAWRQIGTLYEIEQKRAGRDEELVALVRVGTSQQLFAAARAEKLRLRVVLETRTAELAESVEDLRRQFTMIRMASVMVAVALLMASAALLHRWITSPLGRLGLAVRTVASGDLEREIPAPGPPDIAMLGADVEAMRRRILEEVDELSRARVALAKRGMIVLTLRDELAPSHPELPSGIELAMRFRPVEGLVSGDWYDVVRVAPDTIVLALVDVSGHGAEAGIFALRTKALTLAAIRSGLDPGGALSWLAQQLGDTGEHFVTGTLVEIVEGREAFRYASAGHPHLIVSQGEEVRLLAPTGPILGPLGGGEWRSHEAQLPEGAFLVAYSDGLIDTRDAAGQEFGLDGLMSCFTNSQTGTASALADHCIGASDRHGEGPRRDDTTVVVLRRRGSVDDLVGAVDELGLQGDAEASGD